MWIHPRKAAAIDLEEISVPSNLQLLGLFVALNVADIVWTHINVTVGLASEANPFLLMVID
jgi:hypothetical protein